jgi:hypothetical protein
MAVPERKQQVSKLTERLGIADSQIAWDHNHLGHLYNWWQAIDIASKNNPSHVLILEDDAIIPNNLLKASEKLIGKYPSFIINLFSFRPISDGVKPGSLVMLPKALNGDVAAIYPVAWLDELRKDYLKNPDILKNIKSSFGGGAEELRAALRPGYDQWITVPNLVQHDSSSKSILGHYLEVGQSSNCLSEEDDALSLDWIPVA